MRKKKKTEAAISKASDWFPLMWHFLPGNIKPDSKRIIMMIIITIIIIIIIVIIVNPQHLCLMMYTTNRLME